MIKKLISGFDWILFIFPIIMALFGVMMIYSASMVSATAEGLSSSFYFKRQLFWFVVSLIAYLFVCITPYRHYKNNGFVKFLIASSFVSLIAVMLVGSVANGAQRTLTILGFNIQPSEFVKLVVIIYLASTYAKKRDYINEFFNGIMKPLVLVALMVIFIILQPDIGTASIILIIVAMIVLFSGIQMKHLVFLVASSLTIVAIAVPFLATGTRIARFTGAYQPFQYPDSEGYHLIQSYLAINGGGLKGEGIGQSVQKLGYLWGAHTDFIMSVISEELGVLGIAFVIGMFILLILLTFTYAKRCQDTFGIMLLVGIISMVAFQAIINLGAISGLLPITGVTLPFISYGGSSLLVLFISMGIVNNVVKSIRIKEMEE